MENHERKTRNGKSGSGKTKLTRLVATDLTKYRKLKENFVRNLTQLRMCTRDGAGQYSIKTLANAHLFYAYIPAPDKNKKYGSFDLRNLCISHEAYCLGVT